MTFFYDLNKRLANLSQQQTLTEGAVAEASYSAKAARAGKDIGKPGKNFEKIAKSAGERYGSKAAGERVAGAVLNKLRHPKEGVEEGRAEVGSSTVKSVYYPDKAQSPIKKSVTAYDSKGEENFKKSPNQTSRPAGMNPSPESRYKIGEEGGIPMTAKQKSFAALAPPKDKITFADKIAGAKQEVEEMLGDVAAEAIKSALTPKQKKLDRNNNGKLDAQDFEMLRKGAKQETDEGWDEMERDVKKRMGPKVGDVKRGARHDIETTATGVRATRRYDDETDDQPTGEKRKAGRPKGSKGALGAKGPSGKSKLMTREDGVMPGATDADAGEYDHEGEMAKDDIKTIVRHAQALEKILGDNDNLPEWVQSKLAKIESMMTAVDDYMQNQQDDEQPLDEKEKTEESGLHLHWLRGDHKGKDDNRAEKAGKKVTKDIEYDEKKKDGIHGKKRGSEDDKAEKAGKKVAKDIEYDEKKKEKKVDETTSSGSVATGGDAPKASKGGMQIGKGIYDSLNREVEGMISESMSINVSMTNDDSGTHKNITVAAADEDAEMLAQLLARAGLTSGGAAHDHGHEEPCPDCGSTDCGCDEAVEEAYGDVTATENKPDWPTDTEYSDDALQYSGGLNKPKTDVAGDGQTTVPNTAVHTQDEDELRRMMEMAGIKQQELKPWERTMKEDTIEEAMPATDAQIDKLATSEAARKILHALEKFTGPEKFDAKWNQDGSVTISKRRDQMWADDVYRQMGRNTNDPDLLRPGALTSANMNKAINPYYDMFREKGWRFDQPVAGQFTFGVTKAQQPAVAEGVVDTVKSVVKKGLEKLGHGSDEEMIRDLQKKTGVPQTGKKPEDKKMEESLMQEFANFRI